MEITKLKNFTHLDLSIVLQRITPYQNLYQFPIKAQYNGSDVFLTEIVIEGEIENENLGFYKLEGNYSIISYNLFLKKKVKRKELS